MSDQFKDVSGRVGMTYPDQSMSFWDFDSLAIGNGKLVISRLGETKVVELSDIDRNIRIDIRKLT